MKERKKWPLVTGVILIIIISVLNSSFLVISAAFYRGSLTTRLETDNLSSTEISELKNEIMSTGNIAIAHTVLTAAIIISCALFLILLKRKLKPIVAGFIGVAITCFAIIQIILTKDSFIFIILGFPGFILGMIFIIIGFSKCRSLAA